MVEIYPEQVDRRTQRRWTIALAGLAVATLMALAIALKPSTPRGLESGSFINDCCGSLTLRNGDVILNGKLATRYTVGRDARGFYVVPRSYVGGLEDIGFEVDGSRPASKLRLDRLPNPTNVLVEGGSKSYLFKRQLAASR